LLARCGCDVQPIAKPFRVKLDNAIDPVAIAALLPWVGVHVGPGLKKQAVSEMSVVPYKGRYRQPKALRLVASPLSHASSTPDAAWTVSRTPSMLLPGRLARLRF
jgi:hypothetical protein